MKNEKNSSPENPGGVENKITNILIAGVGGQGILLAAELIGIAAEMNGYDVKKSEVHGMAQRGGSVNSHIRIGKEVFSPTIPQGEADFLLAFEQLEALRFAHWLKKDGVCIFNNQRIVPVTSFITGIPYPEKVKETLEQSGVKTYEINATETAKKLRNLRVVNMILLGALSDFLPLRFDSWESAIESHVKPAFREVNMNAFKIGKDILGGSVK